MISKMPKTVEAIPPLINWCCHAVRLLASASSGTSHPGGGRAGPRGVHPSLGISVHAERILNCRPPKTDRALGADECQQVRVDLVFMGGAHAVRRTLIDLQLSALDNFGG